MQQSVTAHTPYQYYFTCRRGSGIPVTLPASRTTARKTTHLQGTDHANTTNYRIRIPYPKPRVLLINPLETVQNRATASSRYSYSHDISTFSENRIPSTEAFLTSKSWRVASLCCLSSSFELFAVFSKFQLGHAANIAPLPRCHTADVIHYELLDHVCEVLVISAPCFPNTIGLE